ncbi:MAG: hypothetical protein JXR69_09645 [Candidatus Delongbacteria bacterium]|nr:hypothetical protein [Candidatus Delongbacteria bacterium]
MKDFDKLQIVVIIISLIAIAVTAIQVITMNTEIKDEGMSRYQASVDSVKQSDSIYFKFKTSELFTDRDASNFKIKEVKKVIQDNKPVEKKVETYWVNTGIELFPKDKVTFTMFFNDQATFNIDGKNQKLKVGEKLTVGNLIMKQKYKESNQFTGNSKLGNEYSGKILAIAARYVYVEHYKSNLAIKYKPNQDPTVVSKDLVPTESSNQETSDEKDNSGDQDDKSGRRRR